MRRTDQSSSHPQAASDRSAKGPSCFQRWLRSAALTVVVIAAALIANQAWIERQINEQIRLQIEQKIKTKGMLHNWRMPFFYFKQYC